MNDAPSPRSRARRALPLLMAAVVAGACTSGATAREVVGVVEPTPSAAPSFVESASTTTTNTPPALATSTPATRPENVALPAPSESQATTESKAPPSGLSAAFPGSVATLEGNQIVPRSTIAYSVGKSEPLAESKRALEEVKRLLDAQPAITLVRIEVHTDAMGSSEANVALSKGRALELGRSLVALGVPCTRLIAVGFGETKPIASNDTAEGRAKNRRTEFFVASLRNHLLGGAPADNGGVVAGDLCR